MMLASGAISTVSWITPMVLGAFRDFDLGMAFLPAYSIFMSIYLVVVICAIGVSISAGYWFRYQRHSRRRQKVRVKYSLYLQSLPYTK